MFILFSGARYYPSGGARDMKGRFTHLDEAKAELRGIIRKRDKGWAHILCVSTGRTLEEWYAGQ